MYNQVLHSEKPTQQFARAQKICMNEARMSL